MSSPESPLPFLDLLILPIYFFSILSLSKKDTLAQPSFHGFATNAYMS